jgi:hypothetical protein
VPGREVDPDLVGLIGCAVLLPAYAWRLLRRRERVVADFVGPRGFSFLTIVIAADVMAARLAPDGHAAAAGAFLAFGAVGWLSRSSWAPASSRPA